MSTPETVIVTVLVVAIVLAIGNVVFSLIAERRNPPIGEFTECDGVRLHYVELGDRAAPAVVLFHGNGSMIQDFKVSGLLDLLARKYRVVCFDRPGFGYSQRPRSRIWTPSAQAALFVNALNQLGVRNPIVFGHSWGTLIGIALGLQKEYPVRGLVLASGYYFPTWRWDVWVMSGPAVPVLGDLIRYTIAPIVSWAIMPLLTRKIFRPQSVPQSFKTDFPYSLALRPKQLRAAAEESAFLIPSAAQFQPQYSRIRCPVHIFHGRGDEVVEPEQAQRLQQALGRPLLHLVEHAGHMVTYADARGIAQAVAALGHVGQPAM